MALLPMINVLSLFNTNNTGENPLSASPPNNNEQIFTKDVESHSLYNVSGTGDILNAELLCQYEGSKTDTTGNHTFKVEAGAWNGTSILVNVSNLNLNYS